MAYGARLESVLGESPRGFESPSSARFDLTMTPERYTVDRTAARAPVRLRVVPKRSLVRDGLLSYLFTTVPVFSALYLLGGPRGMNLVIVGLQASTVVVYAVALLLYRRVFIELDADSIVERPPIGRLRSHPLRGVAVVAVADTYRESSAEVVSLLFVGDSRGRRLLRMRGTFWEQGDIDRVTRAVGEERLQIHDPISVAELFERYPGSRYWFESNPAVWLGTAVLVTVGGVASIVGLMVISGIPLA